MEIDIHLSPFSWQLLHSRLTPALWFWVAVPQTPWKPFVWPWPINTYCASIVILTTMQAHRRKSKELEQRSRKVQMLPRRTHLPGQPSFVWSNFHWTPLSWTKTAIADCLTKKGLKRTNLIQFSMANHIFAFFFICHKYWWQNPAWYKFFNMIHMRVWIFPLPGILKAAGGWSPPLTALLHHFNWNLFAHSTFTNRNVFSLSYRIWNSALSKIGTIAYQIEKLHFLSLCLLEIFPRFIKGDIF